MDRYRRCNAKAGDWIKYDDAQATIAELEQKLDNATKGGCGKPGHTTCTGDEGTSYCLTCELDQKLADGLQENASLVASIRAMRERAEFAEQKLAEAEVLKTEKEKELYRLAAYYSVACKDLATAQTQLKRLGEVDRKATANIAKWGQQDLITLGLCVAEEAGELAQAILQYKHENGPKERIEQEAIDLGALCIQVIQSKQALEGRE